MRSALRFWLSVTITLIVTGLAAATAWAQSGPIRINEFMASNLNYTNADGSVSDWIELYNTNATSISLGGYSISDSNAYPQRYIFSNTVTIPGKGYFVVTCDSSKPSSASNAPFGLTKSGGYVYLYATGSSLVDAVQYGIQADDYSLGRVPTVTGPWTLCTPTMRATNVAAALGSNTRLKINEWMADDGSGNDWFELYNPTNKPVAIGGLYLQSTNSGKVSVIPPLSFIGSGFFSGGYLKFIADGVTNAYNADHTYCKLNSGTDTLTLFQTDFSTVIDSVHFSSQITHVSEGRLPDGTTNIVKFTKINDYDTTTPGEPNSLITTNLFINELLAHTDPPLEDAVEFQNVSTNTIDISGWWISNNRLKPMKARIPTGPPIAPGGFRVIYQYMFNISDTFDYPAGFSTNGILEEFTFNSAHGDECHLFQTDTNGNLTGYRVGEVFESSDNGISFGHYNTSVPGDYKFVAMSNLTFGTSVTATSAPSLITYFRTGLGASNNYPRVGPIVISEIMYNPYTNVFTGSNYVENPLEEYIELRNTTNGYVPLYYYDPANPSFSTNSWRLKTAVSFTFSNGTVIKPYGFCLVVGFDPQTNYTALTNFCYKYNVSTNSASTNYAPIYGPWIGRLANGGDAVELYYPDTPQLPPHPDAGYVPYIRADKVNYLSSGAWAQANGDSNSLQRLNQTLFGNDPINWVANRPSAGKVNPLGDNDGDGIPNDWEILYSLNPNDPSDADIDLDGDGMSNRQEYWAGTNPRDLNSVLKLRMTYTSTNSPATLTFLAISNHTYGVQVAGKMKDNPNWDRLTNISITAPTNRIITVTDTNPPNASDRYFRVRTPM